MLLAVSANRSTRSRASPSSRPVASAPGSSEAISKRFRSSRRTRSTAIGQPYANRLVETVEAMVVRGDEQAQGILHPVHVKGAGAGYRFDVGPVAGAVEHRLEDDQLDRCEHRDGRALERHGPRVARGLPVDRRVVEEEVD